ncbi:hypothetical protein [Ureibacillus sinduriensis]|nr:hypothetical protein [Ureibacillus sinduriensis]
MSIIWGRLIDGLSLCLSKNGCIVLLVYNVRAYPKHYDIIYKVNVGD